MARPASDNTTAVWKFLRGKGFSPAQTAGIIGTMQQESGRGLSTTAKNPSSGAYGIAQWLGGRKSALFARGNPASLDTQLRHLWSELQGPERGALAKVKQAHTIEDATRAWLMGFERPGPNEMVLGRRVSNARNVFNRLSGVPGGGGDEGGGTAGAAGGGRTRTTTTTTPGVDNSQARAMLVQQFLGNKNADVLDFAVQARSLKDIPGTTSTKTERIPGSSGATPEVRGAAAGSGAAQALNWVQAKLEDQPGSREAGGANQGKLAGYLNSRFGMSGAPWCAMFTSAAVTKGGAPPSARTASVAQVRAKAQAGQGYQRGFIGAGEARPGDLVLFGNSHIGLITGVKNGQIQYIGGNQSNTVSRGTTRAGGGVSIVRPKYGARR